MQSLTTRYDGQPFGLSVQQLTDIITINGTRTPAYSTQYRSPRFRILDTTLTPVPTGGVGPLGDVGDISQFVAGCQITNDTTRSVHRDAQLAFREDLGWIFNPLQHVVQCFADLWSDFPYMQTATGTVRNPHAALLAEVPMGIFTAILPDRDLQPSGNTWSLDMLDLTSWIAQCGFINTYVVPVGTKYTDAITRILTMSYLPASRGGTGTTPVGLDDAGPNIPSSRINIPASALVTPAPITFTRQMTKLDAVNQLLDAITYWPLWVDEVGVFQSAPKPNYSQSIPAASWTYVNADASSILQGPVQERWTNQADLANVIVVYSENNNLTTPLFSVRYNDQTAQSRIALANMGRAIQKTIQDDKIPDQATCDLRAYVELQYAALLAEQVSFATTINPFHQSHDHLSLTYTDPTTGVVQLTSANGFEEVSWSADLFAWTQTHLVGTAVVL